VYFIIFSSNYVLLRAQDDVLVESKRYGFWLSSITFVGKEEFNGYVSEEISKK
jgi:hypothetical protein